MTTGRGCSQIVGVGVVFAVRFLVAVVRFVVGEVPFVLSNSAESSAGFQCGSLR